MINTKGIKKGQLHDIYPQLYGCFYEESEMDIRFTKLIETHCNLFGKDEAMIFSTAGRSELGGNHTDHNLGKVLAATITLDTVGAVTITDNNIVTLVSEGFPSVEVNLDNLDKIDSEENTTNALIRGIARGFADKGLKIGGFNANTTTNVLMGSGLSSSAAIEILCATIINHLYNNDKLNPVELSKISQFAENVFYGKPSGLMDQIACASGGIVSIDFKDKENPVVISEKIKFEDKGYALIIVDTEGDHANLTSYYASIPVEMNKVAAFFNKKVLREVSYEEFKANIPALRKALNNDRALLRAHHFYNENERVDKLVEAIDKNDFKKYLELINECGRSSFCYLQNLYAEPRNQGLSLGLALSESILEGDGASRVHGGGFAGTIQAYVPMAKVQTYVDEMNRVFGDKAATVLSVRELPTTCIA
ncbi:MAG: galactokinase [Spirochaetaceae bacterium]|nr:galactokinase [Spirochaetaceae bacterium]